MPAPAKVFGDLHGQFRDLLLLFGHHGFPSHYLGGDVETTAYVFNGDFVDRGAHQLEVVALLFALRVLYPWRVFLVRGNHEFREQNIQQGADGFMESCRAHFCGIARPSGETQHQSGGAAAAAALKAFESVHSTFDWLPLAAMIQDSVLVLHGGIGDGSWGIGDLRNVPRPLFDEVRAQIRDTFSTTAITYHTDSLIELIAPLLLTHGTAANAPAVPAVLAVPVMRSLLLHNSV